KVRAAGHRTVSCSVPGAMCAVAIVVIRFSLAVDQIMECNDAVGRCSQVLMRINAGVKHCNGHIFSAEMVPFPDAPAADLFIGDIEICRDGAVIINLFYDFVILDLLYLFSCQYTFDTVDDTDFLIQMIMGISIAF